jgi:hypothetical protein
MFMYYVLSWTLCLVSIYIKLEYSMVAGVIVPVCSFEHYLSQRIWHRVRVSNKNNNYEYRLKIFEG